MNTHMLTKNKATKLSRAIIGRQVSNKVVLYLNTLRFLMQWGQEGGPDQHLMPAYMFVHSAAH